MSDIVVTVPRVVYSLRAKNVCNIACGALHNVAVTSEGRVRLWYYCGVRGPRVQCECVDHGGDRCVDVYVCTNANTHTHTK